MRMRLNVLPVLFLTVNPFAIFGQDQPSPKSLKGLHGVFFQVYSDQGLQHSMEIQVNLRWTPPVRQTVKTLFTVR